MKTKLISTRKIAFEMTSSDPNIGKLKWIECLKVNGYT